MAINSTPATPQETAPMSQTSMQQKLEQAEYFIKDLGVWDHFQKFLTERKTSC
jgi:hypothetical protein